jgi:hypothetical protein
MDGGRGKILKPMEDQMLNVEKALANNILFRTLVPELLFGNRFELFSVSKGGG